MNNTFENIEDYFCNRLSPEEKRLFEDKCANDQDFAKDVAFYVATRAALKEELHEEKRKTFDTLYPDLSSKRGPAGKVIALWPYIGAAAACIILFFTWLIAFKQPAPSEIASDYIHENIESLSVTMGSGVDSLQQGVNAYNEKDYGRAEEVFKSLAQQKETRPEAVKYLGFVYLISGKNELAVLEFDTLSRMHHLFANPGYFYKAVALMKIGTPKDLEEAEKLLQLVKEKKLPGYKEADEWKLK